MRSWSDSALAGSLSGFAVRAVTQPLDVIKIRFQLQLESISKSPTSYYQGLTHCVKRIYLEEGISGFWKGHVAAQILSITFVGVQFLVFDQSSKQLQELHFTGKREVVDFIAGGMSGISSTFVTYPLDFIRTRLAAQGQHKVYRGILHGLRQGITMEGFLSLYRGFLPACLLVVPQSGVQFLTFHFLNSIYPSANSDKSNGLKNLLCGAGAGLVSKTAVYPLDLAKKRLQILGFEEARKPFGRLPTVSGLSLCIRRVINEEGVLGLYKGLLPSNIKAACVSGLIFFSYNWLLDFFSKYRNTHVK